MLLVLYCLTERNTMRTTDNPKEVQIGLRLPKDLKKQFEDKTWELRTNMSEVARTLIEDWLKKQSKNNQKAV